MRSLVLRAGGRRVRYLLLMGCLILGVLGLGAVEAHAATPSSLAGETFTSHEVKGSTLSGTCNGTSEGSVHFSVSGTAAGPFPGTFTESGSFSTHRGGFFTSFSSTFTITSAAGTVTGTGSLPKNSVGKASCFPVGTVLDVSIDDLVINYSATIPGGGQDTGTATVSMLGTLGSQLFSFSENFGSTGAVQLPTSKAQCKHGGWKSFGTVFKNQGDCVAFVASGGKNPPSGKGSLGAAPYTVCQSGCPYDNLQSAIQAVENGTIKNPITVGPGDYQGTNASVKGSVAIRGVGDGSDGTILDGSGSGPVILLEKPGNLTISGVEIYHGNSDLDGGGIFNVGATVTFDGPVSITNNAATGNGGGISNDGGTVNFDAGSTVSITGNTARVDGGGIYNTGGTVNFDAGSTVSITGNFPDNCVGTTSCP